MMAEDPLRCVVDGAATALENAQILDRIRLP
jgi:hypothetical protein